MNSFVSKVENIISNDIGNRGIKNLIIKNELDNICKELQIAKTIIITTGFYVPRANAGETDGPIGAIGIANSLLKLNKEVIIAVDNLNYPLIKACIDVLNIKVKVEVLPINTSSITVCNLIDKYDPSHILAIEKVGKAKDGEYYNMRGENVSHYTLNMDNLFSHAKSKNITTIGIGDGGNEIGMGKIYDKILSSVYLGEKIGCITATDYNLVCGVSNWAGYAISATLSAYNRENLHYSLCTEKKLLGALLEAGAVDGRTLKKDLSVDGFCLDIHLDILKDITYITHDYLLNLKSSK